MSALQVAATLAQADAEAKGSQYREADERFQEQASQTASLRRQASEAAALAAVSGVQAGQLVAQLHRFGGNDFTVRLLTTDDPEHYLDQLSAIQSVGDQVRRVFEKAVQGSACGR